MGFPKNVMLRLKLGLSPVGTNQAKGARVVLGGGELFQ